MTPAKYVFAHFMVGNTYPYIIDDWTADIEDASANNIDGFALNVGKEAWQHDRVATCFEAAQRVSAPFQLFLSFDMRGVVSILASAPADVDLLCRYLAAFGTHPRMFQYGGKVLVSTFAGEGSTFGHADQDAWVFAKKAMESVVPIHFMPALFVDPARYPAMPALDGVFNWNGGWPLHLTPAHPRHEIESPALETDRHHLDHLGSGRTFMAAVSPWFFTHYGPDTWNKNWIYRGDDWLFARRWEQLIAARASIDIVQVISWNDYGESHYICPTIRGAQPASHAWVDGFPHGAWLRLNSYFARAFKGGAYPAIEKDRIFLWGRPHPRAAHAPEGVPRPRNWELTDDAFWVVVLCPAPASVSLYAGDDDENTFEVGAGMTKLARSLVVGRGMRATVRRRGIIVADCDAEGFVFEGQPSVYNFNAFTAMG